MRVHGLLLDVMLRPKALLLNGTLKLNLNERIQEQKRSCAAFG